MEATEKVFFGQVYEPSTAEQVAAALAARNARSLKHYELKRTAREVGQLEGRPVRTVALIYEDRRHG